MENNKLYYKGYYSEIKFDSDLLILYGKIEDIEDLVDFESENSKEIEREFHNAVDEYLAFCENVSETPDRLSWRRLKRNENCRFIKKWTC